jgi:hypothetical protein
MMMSSQLEEPQSSMRIGGGMGGEIVQLNFLMEISLTEEKIKEYEIFGVTRSVKHGL